MNQPDGQERWILHIRKDHLKFSAAHMTVFPDGRKERLHGHNYQVQLDVILSAAPKLPRLLSYQVLKRAMRAACADWDEKVLIPQENPWFEWLPGPAEEYAFRLCGKRYVLPADEVVALATDNITAENLARLLFARFWTELAKNRVQPWRGQIREVRLRIDEAHGQGATYAIVLAPTAPDHDARA